jgi:hypothetical protein
MVSSRVQRPQDASPLSAFSQAELAVVERGFVAIGYELRDGRLTVRVSQSRPCDLIVASTVERFRGDGYTRALDATTKVHIPAGSNVVDGLLKVLQRPPR